MLCSVIPLTTSHPSHFSFLLPLHHLQIAASLSTNLTSITSDHGHPICAARALAPHLQVSPVCSFRHGRPQCFGAPARLPPTKSPMGRPRQCTALGTLRQQPFGQHSTYCALFISRYLQFQCSGHLGSCHHRGLHFNSFLFFFFIGLAITDSQLISVPIYKDPQSHSG